MQETQDRPPRRLTAAAPLLLALFAAAALAASPADAFPNQPDGFGEARFGMGVAAVQKHFPGMKPLLRPAASSAETRIGLEVFEVDGQEVLGLSPCRVRFYFGNDELYKLGFDCEQDEPLFRRLKERFGVASERVGGQVHWLSERRAVSVDPGSRRFAFSDRQRDRAVQLTIYHTARAEPAPREPAAQEPRPAPPAAEGSPDRKKDRKKVREFDWFDEGKVLSEQLERLSQAESEEEIVRALISLTILDAEAVPSVATYLKHPDGLVFEGAVSSLEDIAAVTVPANEEESALRALGTVLEDPEASPERKLRVIEALMFLHGEDGAVRELTRALADPSPEVRREAAMTVALTRDGAAIPALDEARRAETDGETRQILARAIEILSEGENGAAPADGHAGEAPAAPQSPAHPEDAASGASP